MSVRPSVCLSRTDPKGPFIATQFNSTGRPVELSCVAINGHLVDNKNAQKTQNWREHFAR